MEKKSAIQRLNENVKKQIKDFRADMTSEIHHVFRNEQFRTQQNDSCQCQLAIIDVGFYSVDGTERYGTFGTISRCLDFDFDFEQYVRNFPSWTS